MNADLAKEVASNFGIPRMYTDVSEMISEDDPDIVDICTPPQTHTSIAIKAMESGCHVLLEKPMALKVSDCDEMIRISRKCGVKLSIVHNEIFHPPFLRARELVNNSVAGDLTGMRILSSTPRSRFMTLRNHWIHKLPGGVLEETGPHAVYKSLEFVKNVKCVDVHAKKSLEYPWILYDQYRIELDGENMISSIMISHANDWGASEVELFGTKAALKMDLQSMTLVVYKRKNLKPMSVALSSLKVAGQMVKGIMSTAFGAMLRRPILGHEILVKRFVDSVVDDEPAPVTPMDGRETVRVMEMIVNKLKRKSDVISPKKELS
jgi:predicted dehydrogenase